MLCFSHSHVKLERKGVLFLPRAIKMKCQGDKGRRSQWASHIILGLCQSWKAHFGIQFFLCSYVFEFSATLLNYSLNWEGILATCSVYKLCSFCCFTFSHCLLFHFLDGFSWTFVDVLANPNAQLAFGCFIVPFVEKARYLLYITVTINVFKIRSRLSLQTPFVDLIISLTLSHSCR